MRLKKNDKGFTLVELIVVIVILAILAAILVPALLGYIDKARNQQIVLNGKSALTAAQAQMSSLYAKGSDPSDITSDSNKADVLNTADVTECTNLVVGCESAYVATTALSQQHAAYTITYVAYTENGNTIYYRANSSGSSWETVAPDDTPTATYTIK